VLKINEHDERSLSGKRDHMNTWAIVEEEMENAKMTPENPKFSRHE